MSGRLPSLLSSFLSRGNIRGFIFDIADVAEWEGGSLEAVLDRAGALKQADICLTHTSASVDELALIASASGAPGALKPGFSPELLSAQLTDSIERCKLNENSVKALAAVRKAGYHIGLFGNVSTPHKTRLLSLGIASLSPHIVFSCDVGGLQPSVSTLRSFAASFAVRPSQLALVVSDDVIDMPRVPTLPRPHDDSFFHDSPKVRTPSVIVGAFGSDGIASLGTPSSPFAPTDSASAASASNDSANQHSGIAIAAGLHCILMRPTEKVPRKLPELLGKVPGSSDRPTRIHLDNYTLAQLVGETLGYPNPLDESVYGFGPYAIPSSQVFHSTLASLAIVNIRPVVPGHVLVLPRRRVQRFVDLGPDEVSDLWSTAQVIGAMIQTVYTADALSMTIQDGPAAGQTVPHVHVHVLPRHTGDLPSNDAIYDMIDTSDQRRPADGLSRQSVIHRPPDFRRGRSEDKATPRSAGNSPVRTKEEKGSAGGGSGGSGRRVDVSEARPIRTVTDMAAEASTYRAALAAKLTA